MNPIYSNAVVFHARLGKRFFATFPGVLPSAGDVIVTDDGDFMVHFIKWENDRDGYGNRIFSPMIFVRDSDA